MSKPKLGFALCGSFCTLGQVVEQLGVLREEYDLYPIMSPIVYTTDTRFGRAEDFRWAVEDACGRKIMSTIPEVEPIGPKGWLDALAVAPCTGNTLGKLAGGITDTPVTMAVKAQLRNAKPVILAVSTNDGLSASARNIGLLMNCRNVYFVPMAQDDPVGKPTSLVADFRLIGKAVEAALAGRQLQPVYIPR